MNDETNAATDLNDEQDQVMDEQQSGGEDAASSDEEMVEVSKAELDRLRKTEGVVQRLNKKLNNKRENIKGLQERINSYSAAVKSAQLDNAVDEEAEVEMPRRKKVIRKTDEELGYDRESERVKELQRQMEEMQKHLEDAQSKSKKQDFMGKIWRDHGAKFIDPEMQSYFEMHVNSDFEYDDELSEWLATDDSGNSIDAKAWFHDFINSPIGRRLKRQGKGSYLYNNPTPNGSNSKPVSSKKMNYPITTNLDKYEKKRAVALAMSKNLEYRGYKDAAEFEQARRDDPELSDVVMNGEAIVYLADPDEVIHFEPPKKKFGKTASANQRD